MITKRQRRKVISAAIFSTAAVAACGGSLYLWVKFIKWAVTL